MVKEVLDTMVSLAEDGMTMLCVTHEMGFARTVANRVIFLDKGEIVEESDPDTFFTNPKNERTQLFLSQILHCVPAVLKKGACGLPFSWAVDFQRWAAVGQFLAAKAVLQLEARMRRRKAPGASPQSCLNSLAKVARSA
jgi:ABC-type microcin C transport system duplicated ATPase subunit YejF